MMIFTFTGIAVKTFKYLQYYHVLYLKAKVAGLILKLEIFEYKWQGLFAFVQYLVIRPEYWEVHIQ